MTTVSESPIMGMVVAIAVSLVINMLWIVGPLGSTITSAVTAVLVTLAVLWT